MVIHTSIDPNDLNLDRGYKALFKLMDEGLPKPIKTELNFDPIDQPISYYSDDYNISHLQEGQVQAFTTYGMVNIVIEFDKPTTEIFIERRNDTDPDILGALDKDKYDLFDMGSIEDVTLSQLGMKEEEIYILYGFAVRDIKPEEIISVSVYLTCNCDFGYLLARINKNEPDKLVIGADL